MKLKEWTKEAEELRGNLRQFTGTENYHRVNGLYIWLLVSDGVKYLIDEKPAPLRSSYWLVDLIASQLHSALKPARWTGKQDELGEYASLHFWELSVYEDSSFSLTSRIDSTRPAITSYEGKMTDFPMPSLKLCCAWTEVSGKPHYLLYLPSEH